MSYRFALVVLAASASAAGASASAAAAASKEGASAEAEADADGRFPGIKVRIYPDKGQQVHTIPHHSRVKLYREDSQAPDISDQQAEQIAEAAEHQKMARRLAGEASLLELDDRDVREEKPLQQKRRHRSGQFPTKVNEGTTDRDRDAVLRELDQERLAQKHRSLVEEALASPRRGVAAVLAQREREIVRGESEAAAHPGMQRHQQENVRGQRGQDFDDNRALLEAKALSEAKAEASRQGLSKKEAADRSREAEESQQDLLEQARAEHAAALQQRHQGSTVSKATESALSSLATKKAAASASLAEAQEQAGSSAAFNAKTEAAVLEEAGMEKQHGPQHQSKAAMPNELRSLARFKQEADSASPVSLAKSYLARRLGGASSFAAGAGKESQDPFNEDEDALFPRFLLEDETPSPLFTGNAALPGQVMEDLPGHEHGLEHDGPLEWEEEGPEDFSHDRKHIDEYHADISAPLEALVHNIERLSSMRHEDLEEPRSPAFINQLQDVLMAGELTRDAIARSMDALGLHHDHIRPQALEHGVQNNEEAMIRDSTVKVAEIKGRLQMAVQLLRASIESKDRTIGGGEAKEAFNELEKIYAQVLGIIHATEDVLNVLEGHHDVQIQGTFLPHHLEELMANDFAGDKHRRFHSEPLDEILFREHHHHHHHHGSPFEELAGFEHGDPTAAFYNLQPDDRMMMSTHHRHGNTDHSHEDDGSEATTVEEISADQEQRMQHEDEGMAGHHDGVDMDAVKGASAHDHDDEDEGSSPANVEVFSPEEEHDEQHDDEHGKEHDEHDLEGDDHHQEHGDSSHSDRTETSSNKELRQDKMLMSSHDKIGVDTDAASHEHVDEGVEDQAEQMPLEEKEELEKDSTKHSEDGSGELAKDHDHMLMSDHDEHGSTENDSSSHEQGGSSQDAAEVKGPSAGHSQPHGTLDGPTDSPGENSVYAGESGQGFKNSDFDNRQSDELPLLIQEKKNKNPDFFDAALGSMPPLEQEEKKQEHDQKSLVAAAGALLEVDDGLSPEVKDELVKFMRRER